MELPAAALHWGEPSPAAPHQPDDTGKAELAQGSPGHAGEGARRETGREHGEVEERAHAIHLQCALIPNAPGSLPGSSGKHQETMLRKAIHGPLQ